MRVYIAPNLKMSDLKILLFILACGVGSLNGQCSDRFADTKCLNLEHCETLRPLVTKHSKTSDELSYLRKRTCGFDGINPKVCCPNNLNCVTPDGVLGQCTDIRNCTYFASLLSCNPSPQDISFIKRSRCFGPAGYSVCCTPPPPVDPVQPANPTQTDAVTDQCPATALPPHPQTGCCGPSEGFNKISGGAAANIDQFPWLVLIEYNKSNSDTLVTNCGGTLISGKSVLTAAHCVDTGKHYTLTSVRLGEYNTHNSGPDCVEVEGGGRDCTYGAVSIPVERSIKHPDYRGAPDVWNDIALLRLEWMATYNYFVRPICLPSTNISQSSEESMRVFAAGWGAIDETRNESPVKLFVDLPLVDIDTCHNKFSNFTHPPRLWIGQICAGGEPGKDTCTGDSGGPLMKLNGDRYEIVGIVSYGSKPCGRLPGVYTNVYAYIDWIRSHMHA